MITYFLGGMTHEPHRITDRPALVLHRARAARAPIGFLHDDAAAEIEERLELVNRPFTAPAVVGPVDGFLASCLPAARRVADCERLDLSAGAHDLVVHAFGLHWANDPVGQLVQARLALMPDGLMLAVTYGGQTLHELRSALADAESRVSGGLSPRVLPMADVRAMGDLLQRAGFALPVADSRKLTVRYPDLAALTRDLRGMGETNALADRRRAVAPRQLFALAEEIYQANFSDAAGYLQATFELIFLTGWAPDPEQPQPLRPGSAARRLADALGVDEHGVGDPAGLQRR